MPFRQQVDPGIRLRESRLIKNVHRPRIDAADFPVATEHEQRATEEFGGIQQSWNARVGWNGAAPSG
jgi:hypothetical protein